MKKTKPDVSVIIPCHNRLVDTERLLNSIYMQSFQNYEIIIIDDNSSEPLAQHLKENHQHVKVIRNKKNMFPGFARNQGAKISKGKYLQFLDNDTELSSKDCLKNSADILNNRQDISAVGGMCFPYDIDENGKPKYVSSIHQEWLGTHVVDEKYGIETKNGNQEVTTLDSCGFMIRKKIFEKLGGFDPYFKYGHEDSDFFKRFKDAGLKALLDHGSAVIHHHSTIKSINPLFYRTRGRVRFRIKHFGISNNKLLNNFDVPVFNKVESTPKNEKKTNKYDPEVDPLYRLNKVEKAVLLIRVLMFANFSNYLDLYRIIKSREKNFLNDPDLKIKTLEGLKNVNI